MIKDLAHKVTGLKYQELDKLNWFVKFKVKNNLPISNVPCVTKMLKIYERT